MSHPKRVFGVRRASTSDWALGGHPRRLSSPPGVYWAGSAAGWASWGVRGAGRWARVGGGGGGVRGERDGSQCLEAATRWLSRTSPGLITSQVALSPKKSVFIGEGCWRRGGGGPQSGRPLLRPRDPAAAQIAEVRRNNFAEGGRARSGARKRHHVIGAVHGLTLCTQGHRFARGPRERMPRGGADRGPPVDAKSPPAAGLRAWAL